MPGPSRSPAQPAMFRLSMSPLIVAEVATVLAVMRRNVRWSSSSSAPAGVSGGVGVRYSPGDDTGDDLLDDHPLIASLKSLRRLAFTLPDPRLVDPALYLSPFLELIRSDETGAPITGAALSTVQKFLSLELFGLETPNVAGAMGAIVDAVTACRFEVTDAASEEAVLSRILQVLLACVKGKTASVLTDRQICAVVSTCFRVVRQAGTKGELLQRVSRQVMLEVVRSVFSRLPDIPDTGHDVQLLADAEIGGLDKDQSFEVSQLANGSSDYVTLSADGDETVATVVTLVNTSTEPFGIPCMVEILQFLCSLLNIAEDIDVNPRMSPIDFDEDVPLFSLGLISSAIELVGPSVHRHLKLLAFVQDELFRNLMQFSLSMSPLVLSMVCNIILNLFFHLRQELKLQIDAFFSCVILRLAQGKFGASYQQQEVAMEALVDFCRQKDFIIEIYANMDCDITCSNVFEDITSLLSKNAFPVNTPLSSLHVLAVEGLVAVVKAIADRVGSSPQCSDQTIPELTEYYPFWADKCEDSSDFGSWVKFVRRRKDIKRKLMMGVDHFNRDPKKGFQYLQGICLLPEQLDAQSIAMFFRHTPGLDKNHVGDLLGSHDEFYIHVLDEFSRTFDFSEMSLDIALRFFLETFRLPGESQKIQRILEAFSERYYEQSPHILANKDAALVLSYSLIMLNTDQHNVRVKKKMTEDDFIRNNRRINGGQDLPREFLSDLYHSICRNEIKTTSEQGSGIPEMSFSRWVDLTVKSKDCSRYVLCDSCSSFDRDMFEIMAGPSVAAVSVVFDYLEHEEVLLTCIDGFLAVAKAAACYHLNDVLNDLVIALCKFSTLLSTSPMEDPVTAFGEDLKARKATETVFAIATTYGDHIRAGWKSVVDCIVSLNKVGLLPAQLTSDAADDSENSADPGSIKPASLPRSTSQNPPLGAPKRNFGIMGRFSQLLSLDVEEPRSQPTREQLAAQQNALQMVKKCQISSIFAESKFLQADSLSHLTRALIQAAGRPQKISSSLEEEDTGVFCLELLIAITLNNRDRIVLLWQGIYEHIAHIVQSTVMPCNLVEKAVFGLLRICQRLLPYKENLADDLLRSLQLILKLDARVADAYCENITQEVARLVKANAAHIKSQVGWRTIISLISIAARHPDACESGFEALVFVMSEGAHLSPANFVLCTEAARQFGESRLVSADKSVQALNLMAESESCLVRWSCEVKGAGMEGQVILEGIREMWLRLMQALRKVCTDQREEVRNHALMSLHGCLASADGICLSASAWLHCFDIIFQLLDDLLEINQTCSPKDYRNMELSLLHAIKLLSKAFLQSLQDLSGIPDFRKLWLEILEFMEKFMRVRVRGRRAEKLQEAVPELLKNALLVMKATGVLSPQDGCSSEQSLWELTWGQVNIVAPSLQSEVFPDHQSKPAAKDSEKETVAQSDALLTAAAVAGS